MLFSVLVPISIFHYFQDGTLKSEVIANDLLPNINKVVVAALSENALDDDSPTSSSPKSTSLTKKIDLTPVLDFLEGKHCLTGVSIHLFSITYILLLFLLLLQLFE